jgi:hypothetical protein
MRKLLVALFCASMLAAQDYDTTPSGVLAEPVASAVPVSLTAAEVGKAIAVAAAASKFDWIPKLIDEGTIEATLPIRKHELVVDIAYTATEYTIKHKSSKNLDYNKEHQTIHKNYKEWLQNLNTGIQRALHAAAIQKALADPSDEGRPATP